MSKPSGYTTEISERICAQIAGGTTLSDICRQDGMPGRTTVYAWLDDHKDFAERFAQARVKGFDAIAEEALRIANTPVWGITETEKEWGTEVKRADMIDHRKLQIDTRLKLLAKWDPKRYGDRVTNELVGANGGPITIDDPSTASKVSRLLAAAEARAAAASAKPPEDDLSDLI